MISPNLTSSLLSRTPSCEVKCLKPVSRRGQKPGLLLHVYKFKSRGYYEKVGSDTATVVLSSGSSQVLLPICVCALNGRMRSNSAVRFSTEFSRCLDQKYLNTYFVAHRAVRVHSQENRRA